MGKTHNEDLILKVSGSIDPNVWDESKYDAFVDELCAGREYQKKAIFTALRFLAGDKYKDLRALARENFDERPKLEEIYGSWGAMEDKLQFPDLLSCSLDLVTGTGKSYVLYGIAAVLLAEGLIDQVLTLCPSNTIESGLTEKFKSLAADADLQSAMPADAAYISPQIINASETIVEGSICVENYHAILQHVKSSIRDSLRGKGKRTLILNDEAHHVASVSGDLRKWKEFLTDDEFGFQRIIGVSGACYLKNQYFADVVSRYSLRQAIEERRVKDIEYVAEAPTLRDPDEKWQLIHQRHQKSLRQLKKQGIRPLTIVVTHTIKKCDDVADELRTFLQKEEEISAEQANTKVIAVTSSNKHKLNVARLKTVDTPQSKVEWIISVSMLTEGWDVKNVFQIIPHQERAFNSKLLIAQVLGRGLRVPEQWQGAQPVVTVFNHDAWASRIESLVNEILEIEKRVSSVVLPESDYHFELHDLDYEKNKTSRGVKKSDEYKLFEGGYIDLSSLQAEEPALIQFDRVGGRKRREETLNVRHKAFTVMEIAKYMHQALEAVDRETASEKDPGKRTRYASRYSESFLGKVVRESVRRSQIDENKIPEEARQKLLASLGVLRRKVSRRVSYDTLAKELVRINTKDRQKDSCSAAELRRDKAVFYRSDCEAYLPREQKDFFYELTDEDGDYAGNAFSFPNDYYFKTPVNLAIVDSKPECRFVRELCKSENAETIDSWIKNTAIGFYSVEYAWSKTTSRKKGAPHIKRGMFSPDFFVKQGARVFVVEIKDDSEIDEPSRENVKKHEYATAHFERLNNWLNDSEEDISYQFNMLTPRDYLIFFEKLREQKLKGYCSRLDAEILSLSDTRDSPTPEFGELDVVRISTDAYEADGLKRGEKGTVVLVHKKKGNRAYEVEFNNWTQNWPLKVKTLSGDEIKIVEKQGEQ